MKFTLLEIIVAVAVTSIITALAATIMFSTQQGWHIQHENAHKLESMVALEEISDHLFRNAIPFHWRDADGNSQLIFSGNPETLLLVCRYEPYQADNSGLRFAMLSLEDGDLIVRHRDTPILGFKYEPIMEALVSEVVLRDIKTLSFSYAQKDSNNNITWVDTWPSDQSAIPEAIQMKIEFISGENVNFLRRTAGNSFYSRYGEEHEKQ